jgi:tetratricopeptide (TPR) repeat protein
VSALELARAVGDEGLAASLLDPAVDALHNAALHTRNLDVPASERYLSRALQLVHADDRRRPSLFAEWAMAVQDGGDSAKAAPALEEASAELETAGESRLAAKTLVFLADAYDSLGGDPLPCLQDALGLLEGDGPSEESICVLQHLAVVSVNRGRTQQSLAYAERALRAAEALDLSAERNDDVLAAVLVRGACRCQLGDAEGLDSISEAVEAALVGGSAIRLVIVHALVTLDVLGPVPAIPLIERYARLYRDRGLAFFEQAADTMLLQARRAAGRWDEALSAYRQGGAEPEAAGEAWGSLERQTQLALVLTYRGERQAAEEMISGCLPLAREQGQSLADTLIAVAAVEVDRDEECARSCLEELSSLLDPAFAFFSVLDLPDVLRLARAVDARVVAEEVTCWIPTGLPTQQCVRTYADALLAEMRGDHEAAASGFAAAAARWHDFGMPYEEAQALLGRGRCLVALGRAAEAIAPLDDSREIFARLGAKPALAEVGSLLLTDGSPAGHGDGRHSAARDARSSAHS